MRALVACFAVMLAAFASGCASSPSDPGREDFRLVADFDARRPVDIAVFPVDGPLPLAAARAMREDLRAGLLRRRYAPIRSQEVDRRPDEYRAGGDHAVLQVIVTSWNERRVHADGTVRASAEARLFAPGGMEVLYIAVLENVVVSGPARAAITGSRERTLSGAAGHLADRLLERLPSKGDG
ncbi:MAG: hypothetical protein ACYTDX_03305 [Planctomycetota bacterium]|jgi:hypothetical protein